MQPSLPVYENAVNYISGRLRKRVGSLFLCCFLSGSMVLINKTQLPQTGVLNLRVRLLFRGVVSDSV